MIAGLLAALSPDSLPALYCGVVLCSAPVCRLPVICTAICSSNHPIIPRLLWHHWLYLNWSCFLCFMWWNCCCFCHKTVNLSFFCLVFLFFLCYILPTTCVLSILSHLWPRLSLALTFVSGLLHCCDMPESSSSSSTSSTVISLIPLEAALLCSLCLYYHLTSIITSHGVCLWCMGQACIMQGKSERVFGGKREEHEWESQNRGGTSSSVLITVCE